MWYIVHGSVGYSLGTDVQIFHWLRLSSRVRGTCCVLSGTGSARVKPNNLVIPERHRPWTGQGALIIQGRDRKPCSAAQVTACGNGGVAGVVEAVPTLILRERLKTRPLSLSGPLREVPVCHRGCRWLHVPR